VCQIGPWTLKLYLWALKLDYAFIAGPICLVSEILQTWLGQRGPSRWPGACDGRVRKVGPWIYAPCPSWFLPLTVWGGVFFLRRFVSRGRERGGDGVSGSGEAGTRSTATLANRAVK